MMVPHYILVEPVYFLGLGSVEQAFVVALVEHEVMVVVEQVVEAKDREESCIWASTADEMHSTEVVADHRSEMNK